MDYLDYRRDFLAHHGIKGQKWGIRRYENEDGTLTDEGKRRYYDSRGRRTKEGSDELKKLREYAYSSERDPKSPSSEMYNLLKKYDIAKGDNKYFDKDGVPYDDYINFVSDLKEYAKQNGHTNVSESDIQKYNSLFKERKAVFKKLYYLSKERTRSEDLKRIGKSAVLSMFLPILGNLSLISAIGEAKENSAERKIYSMKGD